MEKAEKAFVLINTKIGKEGKTIKSLNNIPEVKETLEIYGVYDIIVTIETENMQALKDVISQKVRRIETIDSTVTMIVV